MAALFCCFIFSVQIPFTFKLFTANAVCFIPVQFGKTDSTASQANLRNAFQLSPAPFPVCLPQSCDIADAAANSNGLNLCNLANYFKADWQRIYLAP
jgi:hypothetical protein